MSRRQKPLGGPEEDERALAQALVAAVRSLGWLVPDTEEEVGALEGDDSLELRPLPPDLRDPFAILDRPRFQREILAEKETAVDSEVVEELARAAREGREEIPEEVEELMRQDREVAERRLRGDDK